MTTVTAEMPSESSAGRRPGSGRVVLALSLTYALYAVLLNSVGTVILQSITSFGIPKPEGSILEGCKDLTIAAVSFVLASLLPRIGYRRALIIGFVAMALACFAMPLVKTFWMTALSFVVIGAAFGLAKVAVYGAVGLVAADPHRHASTISFVEGIFMVGVLVGYWLFAAFIDPHSTFGWLRVYWVLGGACLALAALWAATPLDETALKREAERGVGGSFADMITLLKQPLVLVFLACAFLYVLIEQGLGTWMPTFNHEVLRLSPALAVQLTSLYAIALCIGRLGASGVLRRVSRFGALIACVALMAPLMLLAVWATANMGSGPEVSSWAKLPPVTLLLPVIGILMSPIYPTVNSIVLSALPVQRQAGMTGLIVVFSALGGTLGSFITGRLFETLGGRAAIAGVLVPIALLLIGLVVMQRLAPKAETAA